MSSAVDPLMFTDPVTRNPDYNRVLRGNYFLSNNFTLSSSIVWSFIYLCWIWFDFQLLISKLSIKFIHEKWKYDFEWFFLICFFASFLTPTLAGDHCENKKSFFVILESFQGISFKPLRANQYSESPKIKLKTSNTDTRTSRVKDGFISLN